jgi:hypothetical protein
MAFPTLPATATLQLSLVYNMYLEMMKEQYPVFATPDTGFTSTKAIGEFALATTSSATYVEISPELTVSFEATGDKRVLVHLPVQFLINVASTVASFGLHIDNVTSGVGISMLGTYGGGYTHVITGLTSGLHVIKPVMKVVSGAGGTANVRYTAYNRTIVKEI